jgi:hypothetical protein
MDEVESSKEIDIDVTQIDQRKLLLDSIFSHKLDFVKSYLREKDISSSFRRDILYSKVMEGIDNGTLNLDGLTDLLDRIEEFGNQHIYLFNCNDEYLNRLKDPEYIKDILNKKNLLDIYNNNNSIFIPNEPTLYSVKHNSRILKFKWVEKRVWKELLNEKIENDKLIKIYQIKLSRGITSFRINLVTGNAELMVQRLPRGTHYERIKNAYFDILANFIVVSSFTQLGLRRAIRLLERSKEVDKRLVDFETSAGGRVEYKSKDKHTDYQADPHLSRSRSALGENVSGNKGSFYWKPNRVLKREILTHIYSKDNRLGIFGECTESEVNHVLSRVRHFATR